MLAANSATKSCSSPEGTIQGDGTGDAITCAPDEPAPDECNPPLVEFAGLCRMPESPPDQCGSTYSTANAVSGGYVCSNDENCGDGSGNGSGNGTGNGSGNTSSTPSDTGSCSGEEGITCARSGLNAHQTIQALKTLPFWPTVEVFYRQKGMHMEDINKFITKALKDRVIRWGKAV